MALILQEKDIVSLCYRPIMKNLALPDPAAATQNTDPLRWVGGKSFKGLHLLISAKHRCAEVEEREVSRRILSCEELTGRSESFPRARPAPFLPIIERQDDFQGEFIWTVKVGRCPLLGYICFEGFESGTLRWICLFVLPFAEVLSGRPLQLYENKRFYTRPHCFVIF